MTEYIPRSRGELGGANNPHGTMMYATEVAYTVLAYQNNSNPLDHPH